MSAWQFSWGLLSCAGEFLLLGTKSAVELHSEGFPLPSLCIYLWCLFWQPVLLISLQPASLRPGAWLSPRPLPSPTAGGDCTCHSHLLVPVPCLIPPPLWSLPRLGASWVTPSSRALAVGPRQVLTGSLLLGDPQTCDPIRGGCTEVAPCPSSSGILFTLPVLC